MKKVIKFFIITILIISCSQFLNFGKQVKASTTQVKLSAGGKHNLVLQNDGTVWAWGENSDGQLGTGNTMDKSVPTKIVGLTDIIDISAGSSHSVALKSDGTVWSWGAGLDGQMGDDSGIESYIPVKALNLTGVVQIDAGGYHTLALKSDGTVWSWGYGGTGQIGNNSTAQAFVPKQVKGIGNIGFLTNVKKINAGDFQSFAILNDGSVTAWGGTEYSSKYILGTNDKLTSSTPIKIENETGDGFIESIKDISSGGDHTLILSEGGDIYSFGNNMFGQLGTNNLVDYQLPKKITTASNFKNITASGFHSLATKEDGTMWSWGEGSYGQLGINGINNMSLPTQVFHESGTGFLTDIVQISGGTKHALVLKNDGSIYYWGSDLLFTGFEFIPKKLNAFTLIIPALPNGNEAQMTTNVLSGILKISSYTNNIFFEDYTIGLQNADLRLKDPFEFSIEDFTGTWNGWHTNFKINKLMDGAKEIKDADLQFVCENSLKFESNSLGNKTGVGSAIQSDFVCINNLILYNTSFPLISAKSTINTSAKHFFVFPKEFINLTFSRENETGNYTGQITLELISGP